MRAATFGLALAAATLAGAPAQAQFLSNYPVIVVPPPPSQNLIMPKRNARPPPPDATPPPPQPARPPEGADRYQGRTLIR